MIIGIRIFIGTKILEPLQNLDIKFVYYFLKSVKFPDNTGYSRHFKYLKETIVPIPPMSEQKRISAILGMADGLRKKRRQAIDLLDELLRSIFLDMFGDPVKNPKGWDEKLIGDICNVTKLAGFEYTKYIKYKEQGDIAVIRGLNIKESKLNLVYHKNT